MIIYILRINIPPECEEPFEQFYHLPKCTSTDSYIPTKGLILLVYSQINFNRVQHITKSNRYMCTRPETSFDHDIVCVRKGKSFTRHHALGSGRWVIDRRRSTESSTRVSGSHFDTLVLGFGDKSWHVGSNICAVNIFSVHCQMQEVYQCICDMIHECPNIHFLVLHILSSCLDGRKNKNKNRHFL